MRQEIIIRMQPGSGKCHKKALEVAAAVRGVESITVTGRDKNLLLVIGDDVDTTKLTKKLKKEVGEAEILQLQTLAAGSSSEARPCTSKDIIFAPSPYNSHPMNTPGRSFPGGGRITCPLSAPSAVANPGAAWWPGEHRQAEAGYYPRAPSPSYYYYASPSPMAGYGNGSSYARAVARSHPANYSPMIERHDYHTAGRSRGAWRHRHRCRGGQPSYCSIL